MTTGRYQYNGQLAHDICYGCGSKSMKNTFAYFRMMQHNSPQTFWCEFEGQDGFIYMCYDHSRNSKKDEYLFAKVKPEDVLAKRLVSSGSSLKNVIFSETAGRSHRRTFH